MPGWHHRGYLPHYDGGEIWQLINVHLGDALPEHVVQIWQQELKIRRMPDEELSVELHRKVEKYLDNGFGRCFLRDPRIAEMTQNSLLHFNIVRYELAAWVVMPNHIHVLLKPAAGIELSAIIHSIKSYTASEANRILRRKGQFWQEDYHDRFMRDTAHFNRTIRYIENNPVKAACAKSPRIGRIAVRIEKMERGHPCPQSRIKSLKNRESGQGWERSISPSRGAGKDARRSISPSRGAGRDARGPSVIRIATPPSGRPS